MYSIKSFFNCRHSIIFKLLQLFTVIVMPILIIGMLFLLWSKTQLQKEAETSAQASIHYITNSFYSELEDFSSQLNRLLNMNIFSHFSINQKTLTTSEYYISLTNQYQLIKDYPTFYPLIEDVILCYHDSNIALTASNGLIYQQDIISAEYFDAIRSNSTLLKEYSSTFFLGDLYPASSRYNNSTPMFSFFMVLSKDYIRELLDKSSQYYPTLMYYHPTQCVVYSSLITSSEDNSVYLHYADTYVAENPDEFSFSWIDNKHYIVAEYSPFLNCTFMQIIPLKKLWYIPNTLSILLLLYFLIAVLGMILFYILSSRLIKRPLQCLLEGYTAVEKGNYDYRLVPSGTIQEFSLLMQGFNNMASRLSQNIKQLYEYQLFSQKMEQKQLQMQMTPHFLYNTYFILHRLIQMEDTEQALLLSTHLGEYFKYVTRNARDLVSLSEEWNHALNYLQIQSFRFSSRITFHADALPEKYNSLPVPRLILQPILENALEHGLKESYENGRLDLRFQEKEQTFAILISDNGNTLSAEDIQIMNETIHTHHSDNQEITALHNIYRRLKLIYATEAEMDLTKNVCGYGLCVTITLPASPHSPE